MTDPHPHDQIYTPSSTHTENEGPGPQDSMMSFRTETQSCFYSGGIPDSQSEARLRSHGRRSEREVRSHDRLTNNNCPSVCLFQTGPLTRSCVLHGSRHTPDAPVVTDDDDDDDDDDEDDDEKDQNSLISELHRHTSNSTVLFRHQK